MQLDNLMIDYHKARESASSKDARAFPMGARHFSDVAEKVIERKQRLVDALGLDAHGRTVIEVRRTTKEALADVDVWSAPVNTYREMMQQIRCWLNETLYEDENRGGKERDNLLRWSFACVDSQSDTHASLLAAYGSEDVPMFTDACGRRMRMGKAFTKIGIPNVIWERRLSMIIEDIRNTTSRKIVLSVNPLDMYLMSSDTGGAYTSCHSPTGLRQGGPWQYMGDTISLVAMTIAPNAGADEFPFIKDGRAMVFVPDENAVVVGRGYGRMQRNYGMAKIITARLTEALGGDFVAKNDISYPSAKQNRTAAYHDAETLRVSIRDLVRGEQLVEDNLPFLSFTDPICASCGEDYTRDNDDYDNKRECDSCAPGYDCYCSSCDEGLYSEDAYNHDGEAYCETCYSENFRDCSKCGDTTPNNDLVDVNARSRYGGTRTEMWCSSCAGDYAFRCERCDDSYDDRLGITVHTTGHYRWGWTGDNQYTRVEEQTWCECCAEDAPTCDVCDRHVSSVSSKAPALVKAQGSDTHQCQECLADAEHREDVVQYAGQYFTPAALVAYRIDEYVAVVLEDELAFAKKEVLA